MFRHRSRSCFRCGCLLRIRADSSLQSEGNAFIVQGRIESLVCPTQSTTGGSEEATMATWKLRRIDCASPNAASQLSALRDQFSNQQDKVTPQGRKLTQAVFGEALPPSKVVERILADVRARGLSALLHYTEQFDKVKLTSATLRVSEKELTEAHATADPNFLETVRRIRYNVTQFQTGILHSDAILSIPGNQELHLRYRPMKRVGICVPGGAAAYPSTLLMTVCPAQVAGVKELAVVMPPTPNGAYNKQMLAVCHELGVTEVYRIGGAQAVAALAYGVEGITPVDMIVGPGNTFVALAKKAVFGTVAIDCIAGPSEVIIVADDSTSSDFIAIDMIAQAEHSPGVALLLTWVPELLDEVEEDIRKQLKDLSRGDLARESLEQYGAMILTRDEQEAVYWVNNLATEHLHIQTRDPEAFADQVVNAGAIFLGQYTPVALGDYAAGPSHVLPTGGTARFTSGLTANDFMRRSSMISFTRSGLREIADDVIQLANQEGLTAHAASVAMRIKDIVSPTARPSKKNNDKPRKD